MLLYEESSHEEAGISAPVVQFLLEAKEWNLDTVGSECFTQLVNPIQT